MHNYPLLLNLNCVVKKREADRRSSFTLPNCNQANESFRLNTMTSAIRKDETRPKEVIPDVIVDPSTGKRYLKGRFLGKVSAQAMENKSSHDLTVNQ